MGAESITYETVVKIPRMKIFMREFFVFGIF